MDLSRYTFKKKFWAIQNIGRQKRDVNRASSHGRYGSRYKVSVGVREKGFGRYPNGNFVTPCEPSLGMAFTKDTNYQKAHSKY